MAKSKKLSSITNEDSSLVLGIDPSYSGTGISLYDYRLKKVIDSKVIKTEKDHTLKPDVDYIRRINLIIDGIGTFLELNKNYDIFVVGIESPSIGSRGLVLQLGGLYYNILNYILSRLKGAYIITIPPMTMKIMITNNGHALKPEVNEAIHRLKIDIGDFTNENQVDATGIAVTAFYAAELASGKQLKLTDKQTYSLRKIL